MWLLFEFYLSTDIDNIIRSYTKEVKMPLDKPEDIPYNYICTREK